MAINENKSKINDLYKEIGKKVYEKHVKEEEINIDNKLSEECMKIDVLADEIEDYRKEILDLKDKQNHIIIVWKEKILLQPFKSW